jgi:hypothetical protein
MRIHALYRRFLRLTAAVALLLVATLTPAPALNGDCVFECWDSTWFPAIQDCIYGPPATCTSCMLLCPRQPRQV